MDAKDLLSLDHDEDEYLNSGSEDEQGRSQAFGARRDTEPSDEDEPHDAEDDGNDQISTSESQKAKVAPLSREEHEKKLRELRKTGVVYFSSIPPYMKPVKLRQILSRFGEVNRIFLNPEDAASHARRTKAGGNRKTKYTEGWAEFKRKSQAKLAVDTLNGNTLGGKKGSFYYDDIINVKYLKHFKWTDLTEQIAMEAQERQERMKAEIAQATRENRVFTENVEKKAMLDRIRAQKGDTNGDTKPGKSGLSTKHEFIQKPAQAPKRTNKDLENVLSRVF